MSIEKDLEQYDLHIEYAEEPEEPIDFEIRDDHDELYATVWGSNPFNDVQIDCGHVVEYDDDETVGECVLCGATCDWHYETSADDGYTITERVPHDWHRPKEISGIVGKYIKQLQKEF